MAPPERRVSGLERLWLAAERIQPGFVIHLVLDGAAPLPAGFADQVREALPRAAALHPGFRGRLVGFGPWLRHRFDAPPPALLEEAAPGWDGEAAAPWSTRPLDLRRGPGVEMLLVAGQTPRLVLRAHHAVADGRAMVGFLGSLFALLRGEAPAPAVAPDDLDLLGRLGPAPSGRWSPPPADLPALVGDPVGLDLAPVFARVTVPDEGRGVSARLLRAARRLGGPGLRVSLPVDLRAPGERADGNLTALTTLDGLDEDLAGLRARLDGVRRAGLLWPQTAFAERLRPLPVPLLAWAGARAARRALRAGRFDASLTLTNLGRMDLAALSGGGFEARHAWWVPPGNPGNPLLLLVSGAGGRLDLSASAPAALGGQGRLAAWLGRLAAEL